MNITELFPNAPKVHFAELRNGDQVAYYLERLNMVIIEFFDGRIRAADDGYYLLDRPLPPLPQSYGALIRITEADTEKLAGTDLHPGSLLVRDLNGAWANPMTGNRYHEEKLKPLAWKEVWTTDKCPADQPF